jgi:hypothetical protein
MCHCFASRAHVKGGLPLYTRPTHSFQSPPPLRERARCVSVPIAPRGTSGWWLRPTQQRGPPDSGASHGGLGRPAWPPHPQRQRRQLRAGGAFRWAHQSVAWRRWRWRRRWRQWRWRQRWRGCWGRGARGAAGSGCKWSVRPRSSSAPRGPPRSTAGVGGWAKHRPGGVVPAPTLFSCSVDTLTYSLLLLSRGVRHGFFVLLSMCTAYVNRRSSIHRMCCFRST